MVNQERLFQASPVHPDKETILDLALILSVPFVLTLVHFFTPATLQQQLAFDHSSLDLTSLYTSALVHNGDQHLVNNIAAYIILAPASYLVCTAIQSRQWFHRTFTLFVTVLPPLIMLSIYLLFQVALPETQGIERGISGVVSGFAGFLLVATVRYVSDRSTENVGKLFQVALTVFLAVEIILIYSAQISILRLVLLFIFLIGFLAFQVWYTEIDYRFDYSSDKDIQSGFYTLLLVIILALLIESMFPADIMQSDGVVNILSHLLGLILGSILAAVALVSLTHFDGISTYLPETW